MRRTIRTGTVEGLIKVGVAAFVLAARAAADEPAASPPPDKDQAVRALIAELDAQSELLTRKHFALRAGGDNPFGATLNPADDALRAQLGIPANQGLVVADVTAGGPAAHVGLQPNDVLVRLAGADLSTADALATALKAGGDKPAALRLIRAGKPLEIQVKPVYRVTFGPAAPEPRRYFIGVQVDPPDDTLRAHLADVPAGQGLVATQVLPDSPALKAGIKPFDLLVECNGKPLNNGEDLVGQVQGSDGKPLTLKVLRGGKPVTLNVVPEMRKDVSAVQSTAEVLSLYFTHPPQNQFRTARLLTAPNNTVEFVLDNATANISASGTVDQRLDTISAELLNLRKSLDEIKKSLKRDGPPGR
jgi:predicted metalloprotease with PDZ domain